MCSLAHVLVNVVFYSAKCVQSEVNIWSTDSKVLPLLEYAERWARANQGTTQLASVIVRRCPWQRAGRWTWDDGCQGLETQEKGAAAFIEINRLMVSNDDESEKPSNYTTSACMRNELTPSRTNIRSHIPTLFELLSTFHLCLSAILQARRTFYHSWSGGVFEASWSYWSLNESQNDSNFARPTCTATTSTGLHCQLQPEVRHYWH